MHKTPGRSSSGSPIIESLEGRTLLSASVAEHSAIHADVKAPSTATHTIFKITGGVLGQADEFTATVEAAAAQGAPAGAVDIIYKGSTLQTLTLTPITSTNTKYAMSEAEIQIPAGAGEQSYYIGSHHFTAKYGPSGSLKASTASANLVVKSPKYVKQSDGLKIATVIAGTGAGIAAGQTATMLYTGYIAKNGSIFDYSANSQHPDTADGFQFTVEASPEQVIPGFDQGTVGMEVGETRVLYIPSKLGYGSSAQGSIPANSNLVFMITLVSIS